METSNAPGATPVNAIVGNGNSNVNFYNTDKELLRKVIFLTQENEKLKGLLNNAISQLKIKDQLIKILTGK